MIRRAALVVVDVAIAIFLVVGVIGVVAGAFEFTLADPLDLSSLSDREWATFAFQARFLKALELSAGVTLFALRPRFLDERRSFFAVAFLLWVTPFARILSLAVDGVPHAMWFGVLGLELTGAVIVSLAGWPLLQRAGASPLPTRRGPLGSVEPPAGSRG